MPKQIVNRLLEIVCDGVPRLLFTRFPVRSFSFGGLLTAGLRFTPLGDPARLLAGGVAVRLQIVHSGHQLIHASAPRALLVPAGFFALLLNGLGLLAGLVALLKVQGAGPRVGLRVAFRPLTLHVSARRGAGCSFLGATNGSHEYLFVVFLPEIGLGLGGGEDRQQGDTHQRQTPPELHSPAASGMQTSATRFSRDDSRCSAGPADDVRRASCVRAVLTRSTGARWW